MEESNKKINFFNRIRIAIFKLEDYGLFLGEKFSTSIKYFLILMCLFSVILSVLDTYDFIQMLNKAYSYLENELPEFSYENGNLQIENIVEAYDEDYDFKLIIDTNSEITEDEIKNHKNNIYDSKIGLLALEDKVIYITSGIENEYEYKTFFDMAEIEISNKDDLIKLLNENDKMAIASSFLITDFIIFYMTNSISIFLDILVVAVFGLIAARFCGMKFKTSPMISLAIYSMTLSITLVAIYRVVNCFTGFVIEYFDMMYLLIAYVYIIAAIMMIKYDLLKQQFEIAKIMEVQKEVHKEIEEENERKKENQDDKKDEKKEKPKEDPKEEEPIIDVKEPDGSEI